MKQSDIFAIIIIAVAGTLASYLAVGHFLGDPNKLYADIKTINPIDAELVEPDPELFNPDAINPTVEVFVGECQDLDNNGIFSKEELIKCHKIEEDEEDQELVYCPDGLPVTDLSYCGGSGSTETNNF